MSLDAVTERKLLLLKRHLLAQSPSVPSLIPCPPFPDAVQLSRPRVQQSLVDRVLHGISSSDTNNAWSKGFWKRVVNGVQAGFEQRKLEGDESVQEEEVHEQLLEQMIGSLVKDDSAVPATCLRTWTWGPLHKDDEWCSLTTEEDGRMISAGTTGLRTWQACIKLANHLIAKSNVLQTATTVVELGAGVGLLSLIAASVSPSTRVITTDVFDQVLDKLETNVSRNKLESRIAVKKLDWEQAAASTGSSYLSDVLEDIAPQLIIGADIVYDPVLAEALAQTLVNLLKRSNSDSATSCAALIASTIRNVDTWIYFQTKCSDSGLQLVELDLLEPEDDAGLVGTEGWENEGTVKLVRITLKAVES
ncbi:hypothetical protein ACM66B_005249 [Microbotryomycetes sp. NB124-2]